MENLMMSFIFISDFLESTKVVEISNKYQISSKMVERLLLLQDFEILIVCDDSGTMKTPVDGNQRTRWNELCDIVKIVIDIGVIFDANGIDLYFLNRRKFLGVKDPTAVEQAFARPPSGYTPLVRVLRKIFRSTLADRGRDKQLLVFIATDGHPTDGDGNPDINRFKNLMQEIRQVDTTYISFLLCTDDSDCINYFRQWDREMRNVDVTTNFTREIEEIRKHRGHNYPFSYGDYVVKALVGAIDPEMDHINE